MGPNRIQWKTSFIFYVCVVLLLFLKYISGFNYPSSTQKTLCDAQCEALCLDNVPGCEFYCNGTSIWMTNCNSPNCSGTCTGLLPNFNNHQYLLEPVPIVSIYQSNQKSIELSWTSQVMPSNYTTIYIIEETRSDAINTSMNAVSIQGWVRGNKFQKLEDDVCSVNVYRVMAINEFGSLGFSLPVKLPGIKPGLVQMIHYVGRGIYYNKDADPSLSQFMAILEWETPLGWSDDDIYRYEWNPAVSRYCDDTAHDSLPIFTPMINQTKKILMTIGGQSVGCYFTVEVRAVSRCHIYGPWTAFTVELTNCRDIVGYKCQPDAFDPPGLVNNVSLSITSTPYSDLLRVYSQNTLSPDTKSPLLINLHIHWQHPSDIGSQGVIDHYIIRSGRAQREPFPIPPAFIEEPMVRKANSNIVELIFELPTKTIPYTFGVQIVAVAPGQVISDNQWGMFPMYTIQVGRNDSIGALKQDGKVLLDKSGIVIVYVNNTLPVHFLLDEPEGRSSNVSINRYALQWGPLVGPGKLVVENKTILPLNQTILRVFLQHTRRSYGIQKLLLSEDADDPSDTDWQEVPVLPFSFPSDYFDEPDDGKEPFNLVPVYILSGVVVVISAISFVLVRLHRRHQFKNLERRLIDPDEHDVDENNDHYFVMRCSSNMDFRPEDTPTVVPDRWELPHSCLKIGRVLGSGAFGQVVKGRVSRSVLHHRGIDLQARVKENRTHMTVAVKMLQENSSESCARDFLNEIQLMKDIGYHRNIVSILGCCTLREPYCLVVEHCPQGDLLTYLRKVKQQVQMREEQTGYYINQEVDLFSPHDLLSVDRQVVIGMEYLSQKGFVHRDLAARNVLVGSNKNVKIGDFGLARYIYDDVRKIYVNRRGGKLPLRWLSPESIFDLVFSTASDVWSFGVLLYEIVTLGGIPYPTLTNSELVEKLKQGYIMERPDNCCHELYDVMTKCWAHDPDSRPSFTRLREIFTDVLEDDARTEYFDFEIIEQERTYCYISSADMDLEFPDEFDDVRDSHHKNLQSEVILTEADIEIHDVSCDTQIKDNISFSAENIANELDIDNESTGVVAGDAYSTAAFVRTNCSNSSFHNGLYPVYDPPEMKTRGTAVNGVKVNKTNDNAFAPVDNAVSFDTSSHSSDEVFTDCKGCNDLSFEGDCLKCGVKVVQKPNGSIPCSSLREDSAIGSINSDDSNPDKLSDSDDNSTSTNSDEYLMPDSPPYIPEKSGDVYQSETESIFDFAVANTQFQPRDFFQQDDKLTHGDAMYLSMCSGLQEKMGTRSVCTTRV